ncbi:hypothetical protein [Streptomyces sp. G1]|uniref:hypothetical protein n=1 Tax=Streptomyces sp. G1 TaxID=361572 RepID=UPI002030C65A|nr:hypothetical protein [Streptomyces sp. G1]MCM1964871.1 hypothetical protein [Streptomyces sp. G1]
MTDITAAIELAKRAGLTFARVGKGKSPHYGGRSHSADTVCGRVIGATLTHDEAAELTGAMCAGCTKAAKSIAAQAEYAAKVKEAMQEEYVEAGRCTPVAGGEVHEMQHGTPEDGRPEHVFPLCRTGGMTNRGTKYRKTAPDAPLTCTNCVANKERRDAYRAKHAPAPAAPAPAAEPAPAVEAPAAELRTLPNLRAPFTVFVEDGPYGPTTAQDPAGVAGTPRTIVRVQTYRSTLYAIDSTGETFTFGRKTRYWVAPAAVEAPAAEAPAAAEEEPAVTVIETRPGLIQISTEDGVPNTVFVTRRGVNLGNVRDEGQGILTRGRYCAWTPAGTGKPTGVIGFYHDQADAVSAIIATHPAGHPCYGLTEPQARAYRILAAGDGWTTKDYDITRAAFTGLVREGLAVFTSNSPAWWGGRLVTASPTCPARFTDPVQAFAEAMEAAEAEAEQETAGALFPAASDAMRRYTAADALLPVTAAAEVRHGADVTLRPRTSAAEAPRREAVRVTLDDVDFGEPRCLHGIYVRPNDRTDPAAACERKGAGAFVGVFTEEGCVELFDCAAAASNEAAVRDADAGETLHRWALICPEHDEQPADACEECNTTDQDADEDAGADPEEEEPMTVTVPQTGDRLYVETETALAYPGYREDRYTVRSPGRADAVHYTAVPHDAGLPEEDVLAAIGLTLKGSLEYVAGMNVSRGAVRHTVPASTPAAEELRAYLTEEAAARHAIGAHLRADIAKLSPKDQVTATYALNPHVRAVVRTGDVYPIGWTFRVGSGNTATYAAVTRSATLDGLTGHTTREDAEAALRAVSPAPEFKVGDRVVCADAVTRIVKGMTYRTGEPARVVVENGAEWLAAECTRANPEDVDAARQAANAASARVSSAPDSTDPEWQDALTDLGTALDYLKTADPITRAALTEEDPAAVEGVIVTHDGVTRGCLPQHADDEDVQAALDVLRTLRCVDLTNAGPGEAKSFGFMVEPHGNGQMRVSYVYGQRITGPKGGRFVVELNIAQDKFRAAGWTTDQDGEEPFLLVAPPAAPAGPAQLTEDAAKYAAGRNYSSAKDFRPVTAPDGTVLAFTFRTTDYRNTGFGWVRQDGTLAPITEEFRDDLERLILSDYADRTRPVLPRRPRNGERDAAQLRALRQLLTRVRVLSVNGDMDDIRDALGEYDEAAARF